MTQVTIHEAKTHLSRLIKKVMRGEEVVIANRNQPVARLEKITHTLNKRRVGGLHGIIRRMGADFDRPVPDMEAWMNKTEAKKKPKSRPRAA
ncbi:MAG: type II toxin-antitoxin system prevent-host-death family antitoxin [Verrucomicrobiaceae bacterium]